MEFVVSLPQNFSERPHIRFTDLVVLVEMDWCVGLGPDGEMKVPDFFNGCGRILAEALREGPRESCILKAQDGDAFAYVGHAEFNLEELKSECLKITPPLLQLKTGWTSSVQFTIS